MNSGKLDRTITIQAQTVTRDENGGVVTEWADVATVAAQRIDQGGSEFRVGSLQSETETVFEIRYRSDVNARCRIEDGSTYWQIVAVGEIGRRDGLRIQAKGIK